MIYNCFNYIRVADDKEQVYFNVYTVEPMDSTAIKRIVYKAISGSILNIITKLPYNL
jgi:hypothetical protein